MGPRNGIERSGTAAARVNQMAFLGPRGTFTDQAALLCAPKGWERVPYLEMNLVLDALERGNVDRAVVPIENSVGGTVIDVLDFLVRSKKAKIRGELLLPIEQCLIAQAGSSLEEITSVVSKPEALSQCRRFLDAHLPNAKRVSAPSTADAVNGVKAGDRRRAAIGPRRAAELAGLPVLEANLQDQLNNVTRFVILGPEDQAPTDDDKTSVVFGFLNRDSPGQLHLALGPFARREINLTRIESRPTGDELGSYVFAVDMQGHRSDDLVADALAELRKIAAFVKVLGSYPAATGCAGGGS